MKKLMALIIILMTLYIPVAKAAASNLTYLGESTSLAGSYDFSFTDDDTSISTWGFFVNGIKFTNMHSKGEISVYLHPSTYPKPFTVVIKGINSSGEEVSETNSVTVSGSNPDPTPTPTPTPTPSSTPPPSSGVAAPTGLTYQNDGTYYQLEWNPVEGAESYNVYLDGQLVATPYADITQDIPITDQGQHTVEVAAVVNGVEGQRASMTVGTTTPPVECTAACQEIMDQLACPAWGQYMGAWSDMIRNSVPPAPNWDDVAQKMKNAIVPAMGQELVNRAPEIAKIIGDDLQSREKPVQAPQPLPDFNPTVPQITDLPSKINSNLTDNIPSFDPDFSQSQPFTIPDPTAKVEDLANNDQTYNYTTPVFNAPNYVKREPTLEPDKGYQAPNDTPISAPAYQNRNASNGQSLPSYNAPNVSSGDPIPSYHSNDSPMPNYQTGSNGAGAVPEYQRR